MNPLFLVLVAVFPVTPATIDSTISKLGPGDTLDLATGTYHHLTLSGLNGTETRWITVTGPVSGSPAVIEADPGPCCNTVEIVNSSYLAIRHLTIDNRGVQGAFAISAKSGLVHHIRIEANDLVFTNADQNDCGISTKIQTWGWEIRGNRIDGAGTGLYLGNSDGHMPFVQGLIEGNLVINPVGYDMEIKHQLDWPLGTGLPETATATIIRHNVFIKNDGPSPAGDRPNVLFDGVPDTGPGSLNRYEVYGNVFVHNPREALLQVSGDFSIHDNVFIDSSSPAIVVTTHAGKAVKRAYVYHNTILTKGTGLAFSSAASIDDLVAGNLIFAATPITGSITNQHDNLTAAAAQAGTYVVAPVLAVPGADLSPLPAAKGAPVDLSKVATQLDALLDFDGRSKGDRTFRGAFAGERLCGWPLSVALKVQSACDGGLGDAGHVVDGDAGDAGGDAGDAGVDAGLDSEPIHGSACGCGAAPFSSMLCAGAVLVWALRRRALAI